MPLVRSRAHASHAASGFAGGAASMWRATAWDDSTIASTFSLPIVKSCAGVLGRRVRRATTWLEAAIISIHFMLTVLHASAASNGLRVVMSGIPIRGKA